MGGATVKKLHSPHGFHSGKRVHFLATLRILRRAQSDLIYGATASKPDEAQLKVLAMTDTRFE